MTKVMVCCFGLGWFKFGTGFVTISSNRLTHDANLDGKLKNLITCLNEFTNANIAGPLITFKVLL